MTVTLKNPTRQPASYTLTLQCVTPALPATPTIRMKMVYGEDSIKPPALVEELVKTPPTITISAREKISGLPDAVAAAPEILAAVAAGHLVVLRDADPVYKRPEAEVAIVTTGIRAVESDSGPSPSDSIGSDKRARDAQLSAKRPISSGPQTEAAGAVPVAESTPAPAPTSLMTGSDAPEGPEGASQTAKPARSTGRARG